MERQNVTVAEAAELTGYSLGHVRWLIRKGKVEASKVGQRVYLVDRESLLDYARAMEQLGSAKHAPGG